MTKKKGEAKVLLTLHQVADRENISQRRVQVLVTTGRLPAQRFGRMWLVDERDLELIKIRKPGKPPKIKIKD